MVLQWDFATEYQVLYFVKYINHTYCISNIRVSIYKGNCICHNGKRTSSDGTGINAGNAGDCSYENPYPDASKDKYTLFGYGVSDIWVIYL